MKNDKKKNEKKNVPVTSFLQLYQKWLTIEVW